MAPPTSSLFCWGQITMALALLMTAVLADRNPRVRRHHHEGLPASILEIPGTGSENKEVSKNAREIMKRDNGICGNPKIQGMIENGVQKAKNNTKRSLINSIFWEKVGKEIDRSLSAKKIIIQGKEAILKEMWLHYNTSATMPKVDEETVHEMVNEAIKSGFEQLKQLDPNGSALQIAKDTNCGNQVHKWANSVRAERTLMRQVLREFDKQMSDEEFVVGSGKFEELVNKFLEENTNVYIAADQDVYEFVRREYLEADDTEESYCDELAQKYRATAQEANNENERDSPTDHWERLLSEIKQKEDEVDVAKKDYAECEQDKEMLNEFEKELKRLADLEKQQNDEVKKVESLWRNAGYDLEDLQEETLKKATALKLAIELLAQAQALTAETRTLLEDAIDAERQTNATITQTKESIEALVEEIRTAVEAKEIADQLQAQVTQAMLQVMLLYKEVVGQPLMNLGLISDRETLESYWEGDEEGSEKVEIAIGELARICSSDGEGMKAFKAVPQTVEPSLEPLCNLGDKDARVQEVQTTVKNMAHEAKEDILALKAYLDPLQTPDEDLSVGQEDQIVNEPKGLEAIIGNTAIYKTYLIHWFKNDKESYEHLIMNLGTHIENFNIEKAKLEDKLKELFQEQEESMKKTREALEALEAAIQDENLKSSERDKAQTFYEEAKKAEEDKSQELADLKARKTQAEIDQQHMLEELVKTHGDATSFIQRVDKLHETGALYAPRNRRFRQVEGSSAIEAPRNRKY